ncbi:MAG: hypothetical protein HYU76_00635, partial [Betaproteobacteria bacterium]|nr:hypothetical protein [Betaproteobacteria bacterium]
NVSNSTVQAFGGGGSTAMGGSATVTFTGNGITVGSQILAEGGSGAMPGGDATVMLNAGTGTIQINSGTVEAECPNGVSEIRLSFLNRTSGGFFVNGQEGVVFNPPTGPPGTGFLVEGSPGIPGVNFLVTYSGSPPTGSPPTPPPDLIDFLVTYSGSPPTGSPPTPPPDLIDQVVASTNKDVDSLTGPLGGGDAGVGAPDEEEKKKEPPVCR